MVVFRVEKNKGYTVMSNHHLRNKALSLKAKGLLSQKSLFRVVENGEFLNRLRNGHLEKPSVTGLFRASRSPTTAALYLVLLSNGLRHSKNFPVKFGFSLKTVPANIAKKLPPQRWPQPFLIAFFNFSHKRPTFAFTDESGYTLGFRRKIAHNGLHAETGAFPPPGHSTVLSCQRNRHRKNVTVKASSGWTDMGQ